MSGLTGVPFAAAVPPVVPAGGRKLAGRFIRRDWIAWISSSENPSCRRDVLHEGGKPTRPSSTWMLCCFEGKNNIEEKMETD